MASLASIRHPGNSIVIFLDYKSRSTNFKNTPSSSLNPNVFKCSSNYTTPPRNLNLKKVYRRAGTPTQADNTKNPSSPHYKTQPTLRKQRRNSLNEEKVENIGGRNSLNEEKVENISGNGNNRGLSPNFDFDLVSLCKEGKVADAIDYMGQGVSVDYNSFVALLESCADLKSFELGKRVHELLRRSVFAGDTELNNKLIEMYGKCGSARDARRVFDKMHEPNKGSWHLMMKGKIPLPPRKKHSDTNMLEEKNRVSEYRCTDPYKEEANGKLRESCEQMPM
ncbi:pentatricopeptide repeat-containing protein [Tripterygium wilfordii]|uniref:Pentatricopeptide repeat-containing protein n=1 Tax=Tripterygium wilfordii TaxID=458696 RepID=A0A7J7DQF0_TRIWF|nr:pentatricopeptide repeat-containing protein [Tripterygium wilfordii]